MNTCHRPTWPLLNPAELQAAQQRLRLGLLVLDSIRTATLARVPALGRSLATTFAK